MNESQEHSETNKYPPSSVASDLEFNDADGFVSVSEPVPPHVVYKRNRELLQMMLRLKKPSRFDQPRCHEEFVL